METKNYLPKITSSSETEFKVIADMIKELPQEIIDQIEFVQGGLVGIECTFKIQHNEIKYILPYDTTQITDFGDYIGIYSGKYFFKHLKNHKHYEKEFIPHTYLIIRKP